MRIDATMISCYTKIINKNENDEDMKTIGDRIEQLLKDFGRARYEGAPPYTQVDFMEMLTGKRPAPDGKYYHVSTNKSTLNRILTNKQQPSHELLFAICDMFNTDTEWILRGNVLEPEKIPDRFMTDEANEVGAIIDQMKPPSRQVLLAAAKAALDAERILQKQAEQQILESEKELARIMKSYIIHLENGDRKLIDAYIDRIDRIDRHHTAAQ